MRSNIIGYTLIIKILLIHCDSVCSDMCCMSVVVVAVNGGCVYARARVRAAAADVCHVHFIMYRHVTCQYII